MKYRIQIKILLFFFLTLNLTVNAQKDLLKSQQKPKKTAPLIKADTLYFPYQEGVQMIIIHSNLLPYLESAYPGSWSDEMIRERDLIITNSEPIIIGHSTPKTVYVFRNEAGEILSVYPAIQRIKFSKNDFKFPHEAEIIDELTALAYEKFFVFYDYESDTSSISVQVYSSWWQSGQGFHVAKKGLFNRKGEAVLEAKYDEIYLKNFGAHSLTYPIVVANGKFGFLDSNFREVTPVKFQLIDNSIKTTRQNHIITATDSLLGLIDFSGNEVLAFKYSAISDYYKDYYVYTKEGEVGIINPATLEYDVPLGMYDYIEPHWNTSSEFPLIKVRKNGLYGYIDTNYNIVFPLEFGVIISQAKDYFVKKDGLYGVYDKNYNQKLANEYDSIIKINEGYIVQKEGLYGFYDNDYKLKLSVEFDSIIKKQEACIVQKNGLYGLYDTNFIAKLPIEFENIQLKSYGLSRLLPKGRRQMEFDKNSQAKVCYIVKKDAFHGVINENFETVIPIEYDEVIKYHSFFKVKENEKWGLYDHNFQLLCEPILKGKFKTTIFYFGYYYNIIITSDGKKGIMGVNNRFVPPIYDEVRFIKNRYNRAYFQIRKGNKNRKIKIVLGKEKIKGYKNDSWT